MAKGRPQGWVLLVEDDDACRRLFETILGIDKYHVVSCANCDTALHILGASSSSPQAIIADWHLPDCRADVLFDKAKRKFPATKLILVTADTRIRSGRPDILVLYKPISIDAFGKVLRSDF